MSRNTDLPPDFTAPGTFASAVDGATPVARAGVRRGGGPEATERAVRKAALAVTDFSWLSRGDTVLIKPVCNSGNPYPATTDPAALVAMIRLLHEQGAGRVVVADMSGVQYVRFRPGHLRGSTRTLMERSGMAKAVNDAGGELHAFEEPGWDGFFEETPALAEAWPQPILMPNVLREVDHVILMPRCGRHMLAGGTLGLKAAVGWWRHDSRLVYHRDASTLPEKTAEANTVPSLLAKQRLVLTSATKVLTTMGPDKGFVAEPEIGLVIASPSVLAHDMASLAWLIESRRQTPAEKRRGVFADPHRSALIVSLANRLVTLWLGGWRAMLKAEAPPSTDLATIHDDRVLRRAFAINGGVPRLDLIDLNWGGSLPI